jgi:serine/threonine-protein kinase
LLSDLKLVFRAGETQPHDTIESGRIISSSPAAGTKVAEGTEIVCIVSSGKDTEQIPNFYGIWGSEAEAQLLALGFQVNYADDVFSSLDAGRVVNQSMVGVASRGSTITLTLSKGPEPIVTPTVKVPNILFMDVNAASNALSAQGLTLNYTGDPTGLVVQTQDPVPDTEVQRGSTVTVTFG